MYKSQGMKCNRVLDSLLNLISTNNKLFLKNDSFNNYNLTLKMLQIFISKLSINNNNRTILGID